MTTRPGSTRALLAPPHHPRCSIITAVRVLVYFAPFRRTTRTSFRRSSRSCRAGRPQRPRLGRDRPSRSASFWRATRRCGQPRRWPWPGYFDAGDLGALCRAGRPQRSQRRHRPRFNRRHRPAPSTSTRSATSTRSTFLGAIELRSRSTSLRRDATPRAISTRATNVLCGSIHCPRTRAPCILFSFARRLISLRSTWRIFFNRGRV